LDVERGVDAFPYRFVEFAVDGRIAEEGAVWDGELRGHFGRGP